MSEPRPHSLSADDGVLVVVPGLASGGTERHLMAGLPALRERGFAVEVFALRGPDVLDDALRDRGVPVTAPARHIPGGGGLAGRLNALAGAAALRHRIGTRPPRALHFFLPEAYLLADLKAEGVSPNRLGPIYNSVSMDRFAGLDRDAARQALGLAGQRRAERDFSLDACTARYARLYDGLLRGDRRPVRGILDDAPARKARAS